MLNMKIVHHCSERTREWHNDDEKRTTVCSI